MPNQDSINAIVDSLFTTLPPDTIYGDYDTLEIDSNITFTLSPNPANSSVTLTISDTLDNFDVAIFNSYGVLMSTSHFQESTQSVNINTEALINGIYYVVLLKDGAYISSKILSILKE